MLISPPEEPALRPPSFWLLRGLLLLVIGGAGAVAITRDELRWLSGGFALAGLQYLLAGPALTAPAGSTVVGFWRMAGPALILVDIGLLGSAAGVISQRPLQTQGLWLMVDLALAVFGLTLLLEPIAGVRLLRVQREMLSTASPANLPDLLAFALAKLGRRRYRDYLADIAHRRAVDAGEGEIARDILERCRERISPPARWWMRQRQAWGLLREGRIEAAEAEADELLAQAGGDPEHERQAKALQAAAALYSGRPAAAETRAFEAAGAVSLAGEEWFELCSLLRLEALLDAAGEGEDLAAVAELAATVQSSFRPLSPLQGVLRRALARLRLAQGAPEAALELLPQDRDDPLAARALAEMGEADQARELLDRLLGDPGGPYERAAIHRERARLHLMANESAAAADAARSALAAWPADPDSQLLLVEALQAEGSGGEAEELLRALAGGDESHWVVRQARELLTPGSG